MIVDRGLFAASCGSLDRCILFRIAADITVRGGDPACLWLLCRLIVSDPRSGEASKITKYKVQKTNKLAGDRPKRR